MSQSLELEFQPPRASRAIYYGWINLAVAALAMVSTLPGRTMGLGLITEPLLADLPLDRVAYGWINLYATVIGACFSLACGPLVDRLGARIVLTVNAMLLGAAVIAMSHARTPMQLAVTLTLTRGLGQSALSVVAMAIVGKWFVRRINLAMAVFSTVVAVGFIAAIPSLQYAVTRSNWRSVWASVGWFLLLVLAPLAIGLVRKSPELLGYSKGHDELTDDAGGDVDLRSGATLGQALRARSFWTFAIACAVFNMIFSGVSLFSEAILRERGFFLASTFRVAMGLLAFGGIVANFAAGWLAGRVALSRLLAGGMAIMAGSLVILPFARGAGMIYLYATLMGLSGGVVTVVFFACWSRMFGREHLGAVQGAAQVMTVLASAAGPVLLAAGERHASYGKTFLVLAPVVAVLAVVVMMTGDHEAQKSSM